MSLDTQVYDENVEKELPPQTIPPRIAKGEANTSVPSEVKILTTSNWSSKKLCFQPGMSLMSELPKLLQRSDDPYEDGEAAASVDCLRYETLMSILKMMDARFFELEGVAF